MPMDGAAPGDEPSNTPLAAPPFAPCGQQPDGRTVDRTARRTGGLATTAVAILLFGVAMILALCGSPTMSEPSGDSSAVQEERGANEIGRSLRWDAPTSIAEGHDVSWPNCPKGSGRLRPTPALPLPPRPGEFVIVGLTEGPGFYPNPCLSHQAAWAKRHHVATAVYAVASYPNSAELRRHGRARSKHDRLRAVGYAQARVNLDSMRRVGLASPIVWIDVEPVRLRPWSADRLANRAVIEGAIHAYRNASLQVGFYSYAQGWAEIVGGWRLPSYPVWATAATAGRRRALAKCDKPSFSGGRVVLAQWTDLRLDYNATCPGVALADYFASPDTPP
jgi:hypothetical protein